MSNQYIGEIRYFPYLRGAPSGWLPCDGSTKSFADYSMLGQLLGTTYGGDGSTTFGLPDLRGRIAMGSSQSYPVGRQVGEEKVTLTQTQLPVHNHYLEASTTPANSNSPAGQVFATGENDSVLIYLTPASQPAYTPMNNAMIGSVGQGLPHENCAPTLTLLACIAFQGMYPQQP